MGKETIELIKRMSMENRLWGAERIRGELLKLGIRVSKRTIQKYMHQAGSDGSHDGQSWKTVFTNHSTWTCDFLRLYDIWFRSIYAFFIVDVNTRRVVHVGVTRAPTEQWTSQQLRQVSPFGSGPQLLIRDRDTKCTALRAPSLRSGPWLAIQEISIHWSRTIMNPTRWNTARDRSLLASMAFPDSGVKACSGTGTGQPAPWVAFVASELVRDGGRKWNGLCNCYSKTGTLGDGCGEINVFEVVMDNNAYSNREFASTGVRSYQAGHIGGAVAGATLLPSNFPSDSDVVDA